MKRLVYFFFFSLAAVLVTSCGNMFGPTTDYTANDLKGTWTEENNPLCYWVYTLDADSLGENYWGKTWDESEDVYESDVDLDFHGNGWFKWNISNNTLTQYQMANIKVLKIKMIYTIKSCNSTTLVLQNNINGNQSTYKKVK